MLSAGCLIIIPPVYQISDRRPAIETVVWMEPDEVHAGGQSDAVWTNKILRSGCRGRIHRTHIDSEGNRFEFEVVDAVLHGAAGTMEKHRFTWTIPAKMKPGPAVMQRITERGCGLWQWWIWPMLELHEAKYTVLPS